MSNPRSREWPASPLRNINGDFASNPRVMAHDAEDITNVTGWNGAFPVAGYEIPFTEAPNRGACLYVGVATTELKVVLESGKEITLANIAAGSFLPILVTKVMDMAPIPTIGQLVFLY